MVVPPSSEVAVLPLVHGSDSELSMFLSMGIPSAVAERIVEAIPDLPVLRPRPNRPTTDDAIAMKGMGAELGARFIVSGTVIESRRSARLSVSLYDTRTGNRQWTKGFVYDSASSLEIVRTIATEVASRIAMPLTAKQSEVLANSPTKSGGAFEWYVRGNAAFAGDAYERAADAYRNALRRDRSFSDAYAKLSLVDAAMMSEGIEKATDGTVLKNELRAAATMSITSDRASALSWSAEARARMLEGRPSSQWREAYNRAVSLSGRDPAILEAYGLALASIDERGEAKAMLKRALQAAPWRAEIMTALAEIAIAEGNDVEACNLLNTAIATDAGLGPAWADRALLRSRHDELRYAWADAETAVKLGSIMLGQSSAAMVDLRSKDTTRARERLGELWLDVQTRGSLGLNEGKAVASAFAAAGQTQRAIDVLELVRPRVNLFASMLKDPGLERLRNEPRFRSLMTPASASTEDGSIARPAKQLLRPSPKELHQFVARTSLGQSVQR
jgi:TolB-like protein/tetratricopeptide (TPR) repeat protein